MVPGLQSYGKDISTLGQNDGLVSTLYAGLTGGFIGAGFAYLFAPVPTLNAVFGLTAGKGPEDIFLWQLIGAGLATLVGPIAFTERVRVVSTSTVVKVWKIINGALLVIM
jgi:hypothetical protein